MCFVYVVVEVPLACLHVVVIAFRVHVFAYPLVACCALHVRLCSLCLLFVVCWLLSFDGVCLYCVVCLLVLFVLVPRVVVFFVCGVACVGCFVSMLVVASCCWIVLACLCCFVTWLFSFCRGLCVYV